MTLSAISQPMDSDMIGITQSSGRIGNLAKTKLGAKNFSPDQIGAVANDFEAQFISQMLENMFNTVDTKDALGGGDTEEVYRSMMIDQYGKMITRSGGIGVADEVKREMLNIQEAQG